MLFLQKFHAKQEAHTSEDLPLEMFEVALGHNVMGRMSYLISCMSQWDHTPWWLDCKAASDHLDAPHWLGTRAPVGWQLHRWLSSSRSSHSPNPSRHLGDSTISGKKLPSIAQYNMSKAKFDCSIDTWSTRSCETGEELSLCHLGHQAYSTHCISVGSP